jgi:hypothetical protein
MAVAVAVAVAVGCRVGVGGAGVEDVGEVAPVDDIPAALASPRGAAPRPCCRGVQHLDFEVHLEREREDRERERTGRERGR